MISARTLRAQIGDVGFEFYVRRLSERDQRLDRYDFWVGPEFHSAKRRDVLVERLRALGYQTALNGTPGTSGEHIIEVTI